jgi:hypothetical protein
MIRQLVLQITWKPEMGMGINTSIDCQYGCIREEPAGSGLSKK